MNILIRPLQKEDVSAIEEIYNLYWPAQEFREKLSRRLKEYIVQTADTIEQGFTYFVAGKDNEVAGIAGFRKVPSHMAEFAKTERPAELYILAVKKRGEGVGKALMNKVVEEMKSLEYTEIVFYSGETHKESWGFYAHLGFERVRESVAPDGEKGFVWRMEFTD